MAIFSNLFRCGTAEDIHTLDQSDFGGGNGIHKIDGILNIFREIDILESRSRIAIVALAVALLALEVFIEVL